MPTCVPPPVYTTIPDEMGKLFLIFFYPMHTRYGQQVRNILGFFVYAPEYKSRVIEITLPDIHMRN